MTICTLAAHVSSRPATGRAAHGGWLMAVALTLLCSCRGLDPNAAQSATGDRVAHTRATNAVPTSADAPLAGPIVAAASGAGVPALSTQKSLSDQPAPGAAAEASPVVPVGHTTPVAPAGGQHAVRMPSAWCPPAMPAQMMQVQPCPPVAPPCAACCPEQSGCPNGLPCGAWTPPGLACPWPEDEYLCDGGDQDPAVRVRKDWSVDGLEMEDTVVHYDTVTGGTFVQPSNRVCVYAPRFAAVRKVYGIVQNDGREQLSGIEYPLPVEGLGDVQSATTAVQPVQPGLNLGTLAPSGFRERTPPTGLENSQGLTGTHGGLLPYEDFTLIQRGQMDNSEKARLAERIAAAVAWSHDTAVQVTIDDVALQEDVNVVAAESLHIYSLDGKPRLQVCKIASRKEARPGETVEFTIRFDNVGDQVIGNVTVIDNLTTRLEYVEGSQSCTLPANFAASDNQGDSLILRWEITEPMKVGTGGVIRFQCRVR